MREKILLLGGGGHCKSVIDVIEQEQRFEILGIIDTQERIGQEVLGYKIIGTDEELTKFTKQCRYAFVTVGHITSNALRISLFSLAKEAGFELPVIVSPLAYCSQHSRIAEGTILHHFSCVNADAKVGKNCIINSRALIEHDATVEEHSHISTGAIVNGGTVVEANSFVGSNATTKEYTTLSGFIKAGSLVK